MEFDVPCAGLMSAHTTDSGKVCLKAPRLSRRWRRRLSSKGRKVGLMVGHTGSTIVLSDAANTPDNRRRRTFKTEFAYRVMKFIHFIENALHLRCMWHSHRPGMA